ncbi:conserved hypothetical protein; putative signal peptide [Bradyrhizobium sp. ORS 278]|nr:conserved hypothetical protein; putative signal peptide [Bradyrhizobium sp. ORS 278]
MKFHRSVGFVGVGMRLAVASLVLAGPGAVAMAQPVVQSAADQATNFKANPEQVLTQNPNGGAELIAKTRDLAVNDPATLDVLIGLLAKANKDQKAAIAAGLGQAARIVVRSNRDYSERIAKAIAETKDLDAIVAYAAATGDTGTAATGAGGAGSAGASGGQTTGLGTGTGGGGGLEAINGNSVNTGQFSFTAGTSGGGSSTGSTTSTTSTTSIITTVSP